MKNFPLITLLFMSTVIFNSCNKEISEPKQKAKGCNVVYLKVDDQEEFMLDARSKLFHKNTASDLDKGKDIKFGDAKINNKLVSQFKIPFQRKDQKADFEWGTVNLEFDKGTEILDTAFLNNNIGNFSGTAIQFKVAGENPRQFYIDSIIDYKVIKWDQDEKTFTFSANATYTLYPYSTPLNANPNPKIYFYLDIKY